MALFTLHDVVCRAAGRDILSIPHLDIEDRADMVVCGASGSGKTTLLSVLAGLRSPAQGDVSYNGKPLPSASSPDMDRLRGASFGFVLQGLHILKHLSVIDNLRLAVYAAGRSANDAAITETLSSLSIAHLSDTKSMNLSFGEAQRVAIARALINRPSVIFADEPTSALDDANSFVVIDLLKSQATRTGAALIVATHDRRVMDRFSSRVVLEQGMIAA
jgi:putative ABC transport system ATP-binding protein